MSWAWLCLVAVLAGFVQGLSGFGSVLLSLPLLCLFLPIKTVIPLIALLAFCINLWLTLELRRHLRPRRLGLLLAATLPGVPVGVYTLKTVPAQWLEIFVGAVLVLFALHSLLTTPKSRTLHPLWAAPAGFLAGVLGGSIGTNGPPIILYASLQPWPKDEIKASLSGYFLAAGLLVSGTHAATGLITPEVLRLFAMALPALAAGVLGGIAAYRRLGEGHYRKLILGALFALGVMLFVRAV
ncbi:sulfite exporter TauE/SafE family protein [Paucidesulfovibrio longus]|uniref:sulfite exporter TauE/SafE family protein n=1 Tax=Paucidesulfovibrio longus TaxID=889 RepID=UPI0003B54EA1|nr:sulfite exporter TauE/SafE family protein [Paucidesulfovibrio longus]